MGEVGLAARGGDDSGIPARGVAPSSAPNCFLGRGFNLVQLPNVSSTFWDELNVFAVQVCLSQACERW